MGYPTRSSRAVVAAIILSAACSGTVTAPGSGTGDGTGDGGSGPVVDSGEPSGDGPLLAADASPNCGNGQPDDGEQCDDGNRSNDDACLTACTSADDCCRINPAGIEPWSGGYLTAAWVDAATSVYRAFGRDRGYGTVMCSSDAGKWDTGRTFAVAQQPPYSTAPDAAGRKLWEGPGITAAVLKGAQLTLFSGDRFFVANVADGAPANWTWIASGELTAAWANVPAVNGKGPLDGSGITAAWLGVGGSQIGVVNQETYWTFDGDSGDPSTWTYAASGLVSDLAGWSAIAAVDGQLPWEGAGITAMWVDQTRSLIGVVSGDRYWLRDISAQASSRWKWVAQGRLSSHNPFSRVEGLTVLTYNIASAMDGVYGEPTQMLGTLANFIRDHKVDIAGLQEVDVGTTRHSGADMSAILLSQLSNVGYPMHGRFENRFNWYGGMFGNMVLSRWPLEDYGAQQVVSNVNVQWFTKNMCAGPVRLFNYHPYPGDAACAATDPHYLNILAQHQEHMSFLTGDFNAGPTYPCYSAILGNHYNGTCEQAGDDSCNNSVDLSWHPGHPLLRIDHVFFRNEVKSPFAGVWQAVWAFSDHGANDGVDISDHYPVLSRIIYVAP